MPAHYIGTAHAATSVQHSISCNFMRRDEECLIVAKNTRLEVYIVQAQELKLQLEIPINGRITNLKALTFKTQPTARLLVTVEHYKLAILSYDAQSRSVVTEESRDVSERAGRPSDFGQLCAVNNDCSMAALLLYNGLLKIITFDESQPNAPTSPVAERRKRSISGAGRISKGKESLTKTSGSRHSIIKDVFNVRLQELNVHSIAFIQPESSGDTQDNGETEDPIIAILGQTPKEDRAVIFYSVSRKEKDLNPYPLTSQSRTLTDRVDPGADMLISLPSSLRGVIVVGEETLQWISIQGMEIFSRQEDLPSLCNISASSCPTKDNRLCLGDERGILYDVVLSRKGFVKILQIQKANSMRISSPTTITNLGDDLAFIGSHYNDSQLVRFDRHRISTAVHELERMTNLAPISDFVIRKDDIPSVASNMDIDQNIDDGLQIGTLVTCSGWLKGGTLRIIRHGVGISERAIIDVDAIGKIWMLRNHFDDVWDTYLLMGSTKQSQLLKIDDQEGFSDVDPLEVIGFSLLERTIAAGNLQDDVIIQVTPTGIYFAGLTGKHTIAPVLFPSNANLASIDKGQVVVAFSEGIVIKYIWREGTLQPSCRTQLEYEISSMSIHAETGLCVVGLWIINAVAILALRDLNKLFQVELQVDLPPRDTLFVRFTPSNVHLIVASGNGYVHSFSVEPESGHLRDRKSVNVGLRPANLAIFRSGNQNNVFVSSDRPTVISAAKDKLVFSAVNMKNVLDACTFNSTAFPGCLAIVTDEEIRIGSIDNVEKLHVRTVVLNDEMPIRIAHQPSQNIYGVLTLRQHIDNTGSEYERSYVRVFDQDTFESRAQYSLPADEVVQSIASVRFENTNQDFIVVGTSIEDASTSRENDLTLSNNVVAKQGRVLLFEANVHSIRLVAEQHTSGCVFALAGFQGALAAAINSQVLIYTLHQRGGEWVFQQTTSFGSPYAVCYLSVVNNHLVLGDLMRSISVLEYNVETKRLKEVGRDYNGHWMTAIEALDIKKQEYIGAEDGLNLFTVARVDDSPSDRPARPVAGSNKLEMRGQFHLGDNVNKLRRGLVAEVGGTETTNHLVFVTALGMIGVIATLSDHDSRILTRLQENMSIAIKPVGDFTHSDWRMFKNSRRRADAVGFIDGDYLENFLDLSPEKQQAVLDGRNEAEKLSLSVEEACRIIEGLSRIH